MYERMRVISVAISPLLAALAWGQAAPTFEVASVRSAAPGETGGRMQFLPGGRFSATNVPLNYLIQQIYGLRNFQIAGDPQWMSVIADGRDARYYIDAKAAEPASEALMKEMVKTLLAERFQLKVHRDTRDLPVYALIPAKNGVKLQPAKDNGRPRGSGGIAFMVCGWIQGANVAMPALVSALSEVADRPVVDKTGFTEAFDFRLTWAPDSGAEAPATEIVRKASRPFSSAAA